MSTYNKALEIATKAHTGQKRWGGEDYITHPIAVSELCKTEEAKILAVLHDTIEDTDLTIEDLRKENFAEEILVALEVLTKRPNEKYRDYIVRIIDSENTLAMCVKLADLHHNLLDLKPGARRDKYELSQVLIYNMFTLQSVTNEIYPVQKAIENLFVRQQ